MLARLQAAARARALDRRERRAAARERDALDAIGRAVRVGGPIDEKYGVLPLIAALDDLETKLGASRARLDDSLATDRADYAIASPWARWLVVGRGALDRSVVRDRVRHLQRELARTAADLGRRACGWDDPAIAARMPVSAVSDRRAALAEQASLRAERETLLAPWNGRALPWWMREAASFGRFVKNGVRAKLPVGLPALTAAVAGWWVARSFSDSPVDAVKSFFGFGHTAYVSSDAKARLSFWVPIVVAALCAYVGAYVTRKVHRRYAPAEGAGVQRTPAARE